MPETILVTGATGTIGRDVTKELATKGADVRAGVRDPDKAKKLLGPEIELTRFDFENPQSFSDALKDVTKVFVLPTPMLNQVASTNVFVDAASSAGVEHIVELSVIGADARASVHIWQVARRRRSTYSRLGHRVHAFATEFVHAKFH